jgi:hypothetical protein
MTPEELSALPEFDDFKKEILDTPQKAAKYGMRLGDTILRRVEPKFVAHKLKPDDTLIFHDKDGSWIVDYHLEGGPFKRRLMA